MSLFVITESGGWDDPDVILGIFATLGEAQAAASGWWGVSIEEFDGTIHVANYYRGNGEWARAEEPNTCDWKPRPAPPRPGSLLDFVQRNLAASSPTESAFWKGER